MGIQLPGALMEAAAFVGMPFPATDEAALARRGHEWNELASQAGQTLAQISQTARSVSSRNEGPAVDAFCDFMSSGGGNVGSLRDFQRACQMAAVAHQVAGTAIMGLKTFTITWLVAVQTALNIAKVQPQAIPMAFQMRQQAFMAIQQANNMVAQQLRAG